MKRASCQTRSGICLALALILFFSCNKTDPSGPLPAGLEVSGSGLESGSSQAMAPVAEGVWELYADFSEGGVVHVNETGGKEYVTFKVTPVKDGICRLRVKADKTWSLVKINKVTLVVMEGGVSDPKAGNKPPIDAVYQGGGVWKVPKLYIATDHVRYRFLLDTDNPAELKYWCATWDNAGTQPAAHSQEYLKIRALGQEEYDKLFLKDNRACWMFPSDRTGKLADFTLTVNVTSPAQEVVYSTAHGGPKAIFIGDSITWQWGTNPREIAKSKIVIPLDPMPSFLQDRGTNVYVTWHPEFFSQNDYLDKGISAERTDQMVSRYKRDVLDLDPQCVVIMGGTNDLAQGYTKADILNNIKNMAEQADANDIKVILCSITPCNAEYNSLNPKQKGTHILAVNAMIKEYAESKGFTYVDYHPALVATEGADAGLGLKPEYWLYDTLHPNPDAYTVMEGIIKPVIEETIGD